MAPRILILALFLLPASLVSRSSAAVISGISSVPNSGVDVQISSPFNKMPDAGCYPVDIAISNNSGQARTWTVKISQTNYRKSLRQSFSLAVPNQTSTTFRLSCPMLPGFDYKSLEIAVDGYGVETSTARASFGGRSDPDANDYAITSVSLGGGLWPDMEKLAKDNKKELVGEPLDLTTIPGDWRVWLGVNSLWMTIADFETADPAQKTALEQWVFQGGRLMFVTNESYPQLPPGVGTARQGEVRGAESERRYGSGYFAIFKSLPDNARSIFNHFDKTARPRDGVPEQLCADYGEIGFLKEGIRDAQINFPMIFLFVVSIAIVLGPVNLYVLAGKSRRHRLFVTTPLLSLGASLIAMTVIVVQDGFGGTGNRILLTFIRPGKNEAVVVQEQTTRTGVFLSSGFRGSPDIYVTPMTNAPGQRDVGRIEGSYVISGNDYTDGWIENRAAQGQIIEQIRPTRARVELVGEGDPEIVSSIPGRLDHLTYFDKTGKPWKAENVETGVRTRLSPSSELEMRGFLSGSGARIQSIVDNAWGQSGYFYASGPAIESEFILQIPGIRWMGQKAIYMGEAAR